MISMPVPSLDWVWLLHYEGFLFKRFCLQVSLHHKKPAVDIFLQKDVHYVDTHHVQYR